MQRSKAGFLESLGRYYDADLAYRRMAETDPERGRIELVNYLLRRHRYAQALAIVENEIDPGMNGEVVSRLNVAAARNRRLGSGGCIRASMNRSLSGIASVHVSCS